MTVLEWDKTGEHWGEAGVEKGVIYLRDSVSQEYKISAAWNGLTAVNQEPEGAEPQDFYADNILYLSLLSAEKWKATIEAYTYPDLFAKCDGTAQVQTGPMFVGQQDRVPFGFSWQTKLVNDVDSTTAGTVIHVAYGCLASPSSKNAQTINDSPEIANFSWSVTGTPTNVPGMKPSAYLKFDSRKATTQQWKDLTETLYGTATKDPKLLMPSEFVSLLHP